MKSLLLGTGALSLLERDGFAVLKSVLTTDEKSATDAAIKIGFPVTLKISSQDVVHKTEVQGIRTSLNNEADVVRSFRELVDAFVTKHPEKKLEGIIVQEEGKGIEVIIGVIQDQQFGPVLMFGLGGVLVESIRDVAFRLIPIAAFHARDMMEELKNYVVLKNPRSGPIDLAAVENLLCSVSRYVVDHPEIQEMDMNPVFVSSGGASICDARIVLHLNVP